LGSCLEKGQTDAGSPLSGQFDLVIQSMVAIYESAGNQKLQGALRARSMVDPMDGYFQIIGRCLSSNTTHTQVSVT